MVCHSIFALSSLSRANVHCGHPFLPFSSVSVLSLGKECSRLGFSNGTLVASPPAAGLGFLWWLDGEGELFVLFLPSRHQMPCDNIREECSFPSIYWCHISISPQHIDILAHPLLGYRSLLHQAKNLVISQLQWPSLSTSLR